MWGSGIGRGGVSSACGFSLKDLSSLTLLNWHPSSPLQPSSIPPPHLILRSRSQVQFLPQPHMSYELPETKDCTSQEWDSRSVNTWPFMMGDGRGLVRAKPMNWKRFQPHLQVSWKSRVDLMGSFHSNLLSQIYRMEGGIRSSQPVDDAQ